MKRILSLVLSLSMILSFVLTASANAMGDLNDDGAVTAEDARTALRIAVGLEKAAVGSPVFAAADVDENGAVTAADARLILRAAVGLETLSKTPDEKPEDKPAPPAGEKPTPREIYLRANAFTVEITSEIDEGMGLGSGFFVSADGKLLTNYHVIQNSKDLTVTDANGTEYTEVTVLGFDRDVDIALLQIEGSFPYAELNKTDYNTADTVYALGSSLGLTDSFSNGLIANSARKLEDYSDVVYIQHTAAISEGNSGGPLMDEYGRVIGLNTLGADEGQNLNFAVPVRYMDDLDLSNPMTEAAFSEAEAHFKSVRLTGSFDKEPHLRPGAVAVFPFTAYAKNEAALEAVCGSDAVSAVLYDGGFYYFLIVTANEACENVPVTVRFADAPEIADSVTVTVSDDGSANSGGLLKDVPDFGAMIGAAPAINVNASLTALPTFVYRSGLLGNLGKADAVRAQYEAALTAAGFTAAETQTVVPRVMTLYTYTNAKLGITIIYSETQSFGNLKEADIMIG